MAAGTAAAAFPTLVPSSIFGADAPSKKIQVAQIGCGRIANEMDLPGILKHDIARVIAVCDLDSKRLAQARERVEKYYAAKQASSKAVEVAAYGDYRELLKNGDVDAGPRGGENRESIVRLIGRCDVESFEKNNSGSEDGIRKMDPLSCSAEPRAQW